MRLLADSPNDRESAKSHAWDARTVLAVGIPTAIGLLSAGSYEELYIRPPRPSDASKASECAARFYTVGGCVCHKP
jgi:hypothetical protein